ncbi:MAG: hypothetical protein AB4063_02130, partial [Crocosphaera sp.]
MANELREGDNLEPVNYQSLLEQILKKLPEKNLFKISTDSQILEINIDDIATSVAKAKIENPISDTRFVRSATINFANEKKFGEKIGEIKDCLQENLNSALQEKNLVNFIEGLTTNLESFQGEANKLGLSYPFNKPYRGLQTQELILDSEKNGTDSLLKFAKLIITVKNTQQFSSQLRQGIENHIDDFCEETDKQDAYDILERDIDIKKESSDFNLLQKLADRETLGKLKREAIIIYLEHIEQNIDTKNRKNKGFIYLQDLIRRLRLMEEYLDEQTDDFEVYYAGVTVNYKDVFARGEAFDALPIIPTIEGNLGESIDKETGKVQFTLGLKLKLNGKVQTDRGQTSFQYNLDIINPEDSEHKAKLADPDNQSRESFARKVLIRVFLYYFIFTCHPPSERKNELDYDPRLKFEEVLIKLKGNNDDEKKVIFRGMIRGLNERGVQEKVETLRIFLTDFINRKGRLSVVCNEDRFISISKEILNKDSDSLSRGDFFQEDLRQGKKVLKYISIDKTPVNANALCQLPVNIKIEDIRYFEGESTPEKFQLKYDIEGIKALPVFWIPNTNPCLRYYQEYFKKKYKQILLYYDNKRLNQDTRNQENFNSEQKFAYRFTWILLSYLCLYLILEECTEQTKKLLFLPMVRLHQGTSEKPFHSEKFLANLSKLLCHIFSQKYRCNSQGFRVNKPPNSFKIENALNSLYSVLPKKFSLTDNSQSPKLEKLAIIIVYSRESDEKKNNKISQDRQDRIVTLIGEVISVERLEDGSVKIQPLRTFDKNYSLREMYTKPPILIDTVNDLCNEGYQDFLYVAQATYTSTLHITQKEEDEELYFMSPTIIKAMKQGQKNAKIYPVFYDKYYVNRLKSIKNNSLYIQDTTQLTNIAEDSSQEAVVFFNLFNGLSVGERIYHGVISYSTLLGKFYPGVMDDADIREALILDSHLKNDILQYLTFFHFSRFEKQRNVSLKLDPYENIIGDEA